jgi:hypothetical protein
VKQTQITHFNFPLLYFLRQAQVVNSANIGDDCHGEPVELRTINKSLLRNLGLLSAGKSVASFLVSRKENQIRWKTDSFK